LEKTPEIKVRFRGIESERWYATPKFHEGQEGIWLLHESTEASELKARARARYLTAPDPLDFHLLNQLSRIRALIERSK
jgi:hypothetical protein